MKTITALALMLVSIKATFAQLAAPSIGYGELLAAFSYNADTNRYKITYSFQTDIIYDAYYNPKKVVKIKNPAITFSCGLAQFGTKWAEKMEE